LFNVPDNATLQGLDTDADGLTDYEELYSVYTSPFLTDTDKDGVSDYGESLSGSDPNNYTDTLMPSFVYGDVNNDGICTIADVTYLTNYLFVNGPPPLLSVCVGDVNGDGVVNVCDIVYLINYLFVAGSPAPGGCCE
jgi:hypothetical protein